MIQLIAPYAAFWLLGSLILAGMVYATTSSIKSFLWALLTSWWGIGYLIGDYFKQKKMTSDGRGLLKFTTVSIQDRIEEGDLLRVATKEEDFWVKTIRIVDADNFIGYILTDLAHTDTNGYRKGDELMIIRRQIFERIPKP